MDQAASWGTQQLAEFVVAVSSFPDEQAATRGAIERAAESLEAEVGALVREGVVTCVGFPLGAVPESALLQAARGEPHKLAIPGFGPGALITVPLELTAGNDPAHALGAVRPRRGQPAAR